MNEAELYAASQAAGEEALVAISGALRAMELFDAQNDTVRRQAARLARVVAEHTERAGTRMVLQNDGDNFFVDHELLRLDFRGLERLVRLRDLLHALDLNEIELQAGASEEGLLRFLQDLLAAAQGDVGARRRLEDPSVTLVAVRRTHGIARQGRSTETRRHEAVRLFATLEVLVGQLLHLYAGEPSPPTVAIRRVLQGLVDLLDAERDTLLGIAVTGGAERGLSGHLSRSAVLAAAIAGALRLPRALVARAALAAIVGRLPLARLGDAWPHAPRPDLIAAWDAATRELVQVSEATQPPVWRIVLMQEALADLVGAPGAWPDGLDTSLEGRASAVAASFDRLRAGWRGPGAAAPSPPPVAVEALLASLTGPDGAPAAGLDGALARLLARLLGRVPPGSLVRLGDQRLAVVRDRPQVLVVGDAAGKPLATPRLARAARVVAMEMPPGLDLAAALAWEAAVEADG